MLLFTYHSPHAAIVAFVSDMPFKIDSIIKFYELKMIIVRGYLSSPFTQSTEWMNLVNDLESGKGKECV
jgi:hypothetical protein